MKRKRDSDEPLLYAQKEYEVGEYDYDNMLLDKALEDLKQELKFNLDE